MTNISMKHMYEISLLLPAGVRPEEGRRAALRRQPKPTPRAPKLREPNKVKTLCIEMARAESSFRQRTRSRAGALGAGRPAPTPPAEVERGALPLPRPPLGGDRDSVPEEAENVVLPSFRFMIA